MKQEQPHGNPLEHQQLQQRTNRIEVNFGSNHHCASSKKVLKTSISVPGEEGKKKRMLKPETVTVVKSPATRTVSITDEAL